MKKGLLPLIACCIAGLYLIPAQAQTTSTLGNTSTADAIPSAGLSANFKRASRFTLSEAGTVRDLCAYLDGNGGVSGSQLVRFALYADVNGVPGQKVLETDNWAFTNGAAATWVCRSADRLIPVAAGRYWIAILTSAPGGVIRDFYNGAANWYGNADTFSDGAADPFGTGTGGAGTLLAYIRYYPASQLSHAGRSTVGTLPSKGMTANFKRGSSFVLPQRGKLWAITAYLDGRGSTNADDQATYRYVIYKDANGVPGEKVYERFDASYLRGASAPKWISELVPQAVAPTLEAGRYWITIHTGGILTTGGLTDTGGVIRNYADGTGNWYGNADAFSDGASSPFGPGSTGNGTISAYISYRPATVTTGEVGLHETISTPSAALTPNVIRWSEYIVQEVGTLTSLHAYLDGLGAASGSQAVRMVAYGFNHSRSPDGEERDIYFKIAESAAVTIPAGMQPRWVDFPVAPVPIGGDNPPVLVIAIQSGGPNAVARDYGASRADVSGNWFSRPDTFADGADNEFPDDPNGTRGTVTLSAYASYSLTPP